VGLLIVVLLPSLLFLSMKLKEPRGAIKGRVSFDGKGLQGATVRIKELEREAKTDKEGRFIFSSLKGGNYTLITKSRGFRGNRYSLTLKNRGIAFATVRLISRKQ
jgi:hypothetical protein